MAIRRWWAGLMGPFLYDDAIAAFRFETASGTVEVGNFAGQDAANVNIDGGTIDGALLGNSSPITGISAEEIKLIPATKELTLVDSGDAAATETGWIEVLIGTTTHFIRTFGSK